MQPSPLKLEIIKVKKQRGFTLIELIFVIALMGIISVVISKTLFESYRTFMTAQDASELDWNTFLALERLANDIHTIRSASDITTISATQLVFVNQSGATIQYQLSGSLLLRNSITLASGIQSFAFTYLNKNGITTATPSAVRYIGINIVGVQNNLTTTLNTLVGTRGMQ